MCQVHPHGRGDNVRIPDRADEAGRFTPTGVGTTKLKKAGAGELTVHPHGRGDNICRRKYPAPRVRFTPTGVGTTCAT